MIAASTSNERMIFFITNRFSGMVVSLSLFWPRVTSRH
jgi:hypothetical protein